MKLIAFYIAIAGMVFVLQGCGRGTAQTEVASVEVKTLKCDQCVEIVQKAVAGLDGVRTVSVDLEKKLATVAFDPAKIGREAIEQTIAQAGFDANECRRDTAAHAGLTSCCQ